jgi:hypothetical protein
MAKKTTMAIIAVLVVIILVGSGFYYYFEFLNKPKTTEITESVKVDNRISPLENQGLILEVNRMRHRGLLDKLMTRGTSWKDKPNYYFISNMDGLEYVSKDIATPGGKSEVLFTGWDSMFKENKIIKDVPEEQEKSEVTLTIMERVKTGLLGRKTKDVEREKISLTYDFRTGQWTGDDSFKDEEGYGHYVGDYFEIWFNLYQTDYDHDGIPYWTEVNVLHTDPKVDDSNLDPDGDGIPTAWEWKWGYDPNVWDDHKNLDPDIDGLNNIEEYQMAKWFADPFTQDIYVEADGMVSGGLFDPPHVLWEETAQAIIERYCQHGFKIYFDTGWPGGPVNGGGEIIGPHYETISQDSGMMLQYYNNHFADERKGIFRYLLIAHQSAFTHPSKFDKYDTISVDTGLKKMILTKKAYTPRTQRLTLASQLMHELGHAMGISPWTIGGNDNFSFLESKQAKKQYDATWGKNYRSVMNYRILYDKNLVDYSDGSNGPPYDQNDWEHFYLPTFKREADVIEEPYFETPGTDKIVFSETPFGVTSYNYSEELTNQYIKNARISPVDPIKVDWRVYVKTDSGTSRGRTLRIYALPDVPFAEWTLIKEGYINTEGKIQLV